jgi:hypothetical protein
MVWIPAPRVDVVHFATPPLTVVPASTLGPSLKVTVPDGAPLYDGLTVAVKVMVVPCVEGLSDDWSIVVVAARFTVSTDVVDVLGLKFALPAYIAVSELVPTGKFAMLRMKTPLEFNTPAPTMFVPFLTVTVPLATAVPDFTVTVNRTDCP